MDTEEDLPQLPTNYRKLEDEKQKPFVSSVGSCESATKDGMKCLRIGQSVKLGYRCYDFCKTHFVDALTQLIRLLTSREFIAFQSDTMGLRKWLPRNCVASSLVVNSGRISHTVTTDEKTEYILTFPHYNNEIKSDDPRHIAVTLLKATTQDLNDKIVFQFILLSTDKFDFEDLAPFIMARHNDKLVKIPVDDITFALNQRHTLESPHVKLLVKIIVNLPVP